MVKAAFAVQACGPWVCHTWHTQILADQLTLFQPWGTDYAHLITTGTPGFSDLPTAVAQGRHLNSCKKSKLEISFEIEIEI